MNKLINKYSSLITKGILALICFGITSAIGYATHQVFVIIPSLQAEVSKISPIDEKLDRIESKVDTVIGKLER